MTTFVLIHGAGDGAWSWHLLEAALRERGDDVVAVDLPSDDETATWGDYADTVVRAVGDRTDLVVVGHSLGGFTAPLVAERVDADLIVFVAGMIPRPGESANEWWAATGHSDLVLTGAGDEELFYHDVPPELAAEARRRARPQRETPMDGAWPLERWPAIPSRVLIGRDDRFLPAEWSRRVARDRLGVEADTMPGGHCLPLSHPEELADRLEGYAANR
ncbi:alpha/beta hydrolase [Streptomyces sp. NPDC096079]|uniref:alpha/beta fold hydrolase n=1 Tax=unclassified Streptomyces TaxID=2593676 RepID=UPI0033328337